MRQDDLYEETLPAAGAHWTPATSLSSGRIALIPTFRTVPVFSLRSRIYEQEVNGENDSGVRIRRTRTDRLCLGTSGPGASRPQRRISEMGRDDRGRPYWCEPPRCRVNNLGRNAYDRDLHCRGW